MQKSLFCKSTPEQPFEQTQLIAGNISSANPFQPFLMPPHDTENTVQLLHLCNQHASISAEWIVLTIAAIQSLAIVDNLEAAGERTRAWIRYSLIHMLV
mmetsp:Transcript_31358/g.45773  ORF Transcript_31358/g.45773 Transcript_31358/m.45773 type:complete len:99 (+) Transcript_31358:1250-1546(+)